MTSTKRQVRLDDDVADRLDAVRGERSLSAHTNLVLRALDHTAVLAPHASTRAVDPAEAVQVGSGPIVAEDGPTTADRPIPPGSPQTAVKGPPVDPATAPSQRAVTSSQAVRRARGSSDEARTGVRGVGKAGPCRHPIGRRIGPYCAACGREV